ncbi:CPBP family intramembrane metalloprotease [Lederbergia sp. NSJ-179]|uniref:CPBP family intramembrane glutamic endopeptidase n=1 Tax=Lederbergia sp. NSJ-179 TaxID=2931402 RepID=UPI001FD4797C|nr:CPBP family intramembrane glutamic endopeptidase [Lederbergia sp. NSJ-179]MCJ7840294.1 CPBP family intramembrane metalloprotease [Lederbergia sp. NSJ-179]
MFKNNEGQIRAGWVIIIAFITMYISQNIFSIPGIILLAVTEITNQSASISLDIMAAFENRPWVLLLTQGGGTIGGILATLLLWKFWNKKSVKELGFKSSWKDLLFGLFLGAASIACIFFLLLATGNIKLLNSFSQPDFNAFTISFLIMFILVGLFEEMFFRGYVMQTMASRQNKRWVIYLVSAVVFSLAHGTNPHVSMIGLINIVFVGLLFAYMFDRTNNLWLPIGYHITWNYFQGSVFGFAVSGTSPHGLYQIDPSNGNSLLTGGAFGLEGGLFATLFILLGFLITKLYTKDHSV